MIVFRPISPALVYLHATKARSNIIGQYYADYKQKPENLLCQILVAASTYLFIEIKRRMIIGLTFVRWTKTQLLMNTNTPNPGLNKLSV